MNPKQLLHPGIYQRTRATKTESPLCAKGFVRVTEGVVPRNEDFRVPSSPCTTTSSEHTFRCLERRHRRPRRLGDSEGHAQGPTACCLCSLRQDPSARLRHREQSLTREGRPAPEKLFSPRQHELARDLVISIRFRIKGPQLTWAQAALDNARSASPGLLALWLPK